MTKIEVPQELINKIIDLYVNKKYGRSKILKELKLNFGDRTLKNILRENNIHIRNFSEAKVGRYKTEVSADIQQKIIELYNKGYGLDKIVRTLNLPFSFDKVKRILQDNDIHIRNLQESAIVKEQPKARKYWVNDDYVLESHNGAYILGFIAADGHLPITKGARNRITVALQQRDEDLLHMIKKELQYEGPLCYYETKDGYPVAGLAFTSKKLRQQFENYGICNNKTFKLKHLPNLPEEYKLDFIRGFFDGDGCIYEATGKKVAMSITCACKDFLQEIVDFLHSKYNVASPKIHEQVRVHTIYYINYYKKDSSILGELFYNNEYISLPRKKKHYFEIKQKYFN